MSVGSVIQVFTRTKTGSVRCSQGMYVNGDYNPWEVWLKNARAMAGEASIGLAEAVESVAEECMVMARTIGLRAKLRRWPGNFEILIDVTDSQWHVYSDRTAKRWSRRDIRFHPLDALTLLPPESDDDDDDDEVQDLASWD